VIVVPETLIVGYGFSDLTLFAPSYNHDFMRVVNKVPNSQLIETFQYFEKLSYADEPIAIHYNELDP
jgi:hypothetical protein